MREEIRVTGFGGQGIIMAGFVIGKAATVFDGKFGTLVQSYGPEARGSACAAQVVVSDKKILYPYVRKQKTLLALSLEGYAKWADVTIPEGTVLCDKDLCEYDKEPDVKVFRTVPATRMAEELGRRMVTNIVMLGFFSGCCGEIIAPDAMREAVKSTVPRGTEELNLKAFEMGFEYAQSKQPAGT